MKTKHYPTDTTGAQWELLEALLRRKPGAGRPRTVDLRRVVDAILYITHAGCSWRMLPHDFPPHDTVYYYFAKWTRDGTLRRAHDALRDQVRESQARGRPVRTAAVDSQTAHSAGAREQVGYDGGKQTDGRKRNVVVDSLGLLLAVLVTSAAVTDARAAGALLGQLRADDYPDLKRFYADRAYEREGFPDQVAQFNGARLEVIRPEAGKRGFQLLPKRWLVERTFGWLGRPRRLSRCYEHTVRSEESFIRVSMIRLMVNRLKQPRTQHVFHYRQPER